MSKHFECSKPAVGQMFMGRKEELKHLSTNFMLLTHTAILAPQGWGKSSLVRQAALTAANKDSSMRFAFVCLSAVRNEERFYELLAQEVIRAVSSSHEEAIRNAGILLDEPMPRVSFKSENMDGLVLDFDWEDIRKSKDNILRLPSAAAEKTGVKLVVCIEDLHVCSAFENPVSFLENLDKIWNGHTNVAYCINGCGTLMEKFYGKSALFYRLGEIVCLKEIERGDLIRALRDRFADTARYLDDEMAGMIIDMAGNHPFYIQQLAHQSWLGTSVVCSADVVEDAFITILDQMSLVFENITSSFTSQQLCYLHAILSGETIISTAEVLHRHHITSATSASRSKAALLERGIITIREGRIAMSDPIYAYWLKNRYFN